MLNGTFNMSALARTLTDAGMVMLGSLVASCTVMAPVGGTLKWRFKQPDEFSGSLNRAFPVEVLSLGNFLVLTL
jgi:hypothetical protein